MNKVLLSKKSDNWETPNIYNFWATFDPCPIHPKKDGLKIRWHGKILLNPPYSNQRAWIEKAIREAPHCQKIVALIPARTDTRLFHDLIYHNIPFRFLKGRITFKGAKHPAPFPSMLVFIK